MLTSNNPAARFRTVRDPWPSKQASQGRPASSWGELLRSTDEEDDST